MHKFFTPEKNFSGNMAIIEGEDVKHISKVLRLEKGTQVVINNCAGKEYIAIIKQMDKKQIVLDILEELNCNNESLIDIYLFQGMPKANKMDLIVQKGTELGIKEIIPVITERSLMKSEQNEYKKLDRWKKIALEACKQSKRTMIPEIKEPVEFKNMLERISGMDLILVPYEEETANGLKKVFSEIDRSGIKTVAIIIGPEGGFDFSEIKALKEIGAEIVTLGPRILRTETAGFVCASIVLYEIGDLGGNLQ